MTTHKAPVNILEKYLPEGSYPHVEKLIYQYDIYLTITRKRSSVLGTYQFKPNQKGHKITVNGDLNPYAFLITFLHEVAHLLTFQQYPKLRLDPHGKEWKNNYADLLKVFIHNNIFPEILVQALRKSLHDAAASTCGDADLMRVLKQFNKHQTLHVENLSEGALFQTRDGKIFKKGPLRRTRFLCTEVATRKQYLFPQLFEVRPYLPTPLE